VERDSSTRKSLILVVDDELSLTDLMKDILEPMDYRVLTAASGEEAVALYGQNREEVDLVVLDLIMPGMGGGAAFNALRAMNPELKIILSSGLGADGEVRRILEKGCSGFIQKPFRMAKFSATVQEVLEK
jgi:CheY-like chemotaxis protein